MVTWVWRKNNLPGVAIYAKVVNATQMGKFMLAPNTVPSRQLGADGKPLLDPTNDDYSYHDDFGRVSASMLKQFLSGRQKYGATYVQRTLPPRASTPAMDLGSVVHAVFLERKRIADVVMGYPESCLNVRGDINPTPAKKFREDHPEYRWFMKWTEISRVRNLCDELMNHECFKWLSRDDTIRERSIFWDCPTTEIPCRAQPDFLIELEDRVLFFDLKVTISFDANGFVNYLCGNRRGGMRGWVQESHYRTGIRECYGKPADLLYIAINPVPPHEIFVHKIHEDSVMHATSTYQETVRDLAKCYSDDDWLDPAQKGNNQVVLGPWDVC